jgi:hypothetical protein
MRDNEEARPEPRRLKDYSFPCKSVSAEPRQIAEVGKEVPTQKGQK